MDSGETRVCQPGQLHFSEAITSLCALSHLLHNLLLLILILLAC